MAIEFHNVVFQTGERRLHLDFSIGEGVFAAVIGPEGAGKRTLLRLAANDSLRAEGEIKMSGPAALVRATLESFRPEEIRKELDTALTGKPRVLLVGPTVALLDEEYQQYLVRELHRLQRQGATILLATNDLSMVERHCDEALLLDGGRIAEHGDARQVAAVYRGRVFERLRARTPAAGIAPAARHGDGRAALRAIRVLGENGRETALVRSGEPVTVSVRVRFRGDAADPVCGVLIRSRVGITVYGTNTELENLHFGPCGEGDEVEISYRFDCDLCPGEYTITVASHDPDGTAHEWLEEAVLFTVTDTRYTTGVANLRAAVSVLRPAGAAAK